MENEKTYTEKDLVDFGNYILSEERKEHFTDHENMEDKEVRMQKVHNEDIENWKDKNKKL